MEFPMKFIFVKHVDKCTKICQAYFAIVKLTNTAFHLKKNPEHETLPKGFSRCDICLKLVVKLEDHKNIYHKPSIIKHLRNENENGPFKCSKCDFETNRHDNLLRVY